MTEFASGFEASAEITDTVARVVLDWYDAPGAGLTVPEAVDQVRTGLRTMGSPLATGNNDLWSAVADLVTARIEDRAEALQEAYADQD